MHGLLSELRFTLRQLRRSPAFSAAALFTLALCIGVNIVMFSIVRNVLLRTPDYVQPQQLVVVREEILAGPDSFSDMPVNANHLLYWRQHARSFQGFAALGTESLPLGGDQPEQIGVGQHTANLFSLLGVQPHPSAAPCCLRKNSPATMSSSSPKVSGAVASAPTPGSSAALFPLMAAPIP